MRVSQGRMGYSSCRAADICPTGSHFSGCFCLDRVFSFLSKSNSPGLQGIVVSSIEKTLRLVLQPGLKERPQGQEPRLS